jgi:hypothetical protein
MKTITLSDKVRVSDPCYDNDVWCKTMLTGVLPGEYEVTVGRSDDVSWGNRISQLQVVHKDYKHKNLVWDEHSEIGVDSGQAGVFCESTYRNDQVDIDTPKHDFTLSFNDKSGDAWYEKMCKFTLSGEGWGAYETGVVTSSGYGDGGYPLEIVREDNGYIVGMRITYIFPDDEEEEEYEEDEEYGGES